MIIWYVRQYDEGEEIENDWGPYMTEELAEMKRKQLIEKHGYESRHLSVESDTVREVL